MPDLKSLAPTKSNVGRKPRGYVKSDVIQSFRLTPQEKHCLKLYSWRHGITEADAIRFCLEVMGVLPMEVVPS